MKKSLSQHSLYPAKKVKHILLIAVLILLVIYLLYRIILFPLGIYGAYYGKNVEDKIYSSASECIKDQLYINSKQYKDKTEYEKSIYVYENDMHYIDFFTDNGDSAWCYILDKKIDDNGRIKYIVNFSECDIQYVDSWRNKSGFKYRVVQNKEDIDNCDGKKPDIIEFQLNYNDEIRTYYLLFIADDK